MSDAGVNDVPAHDILPTSVVTRRLKGADVTAPAALVDTLSAIISEHRTLYEWASAQPQPRALRGRAPVYVAELPDGAETVVVRHAWHGGLLAPLTGDRFLRPTRAPIELSMSERLRRANIPSTIVLGYARYDLWQGFCRVDVISRFIPNAFDLGMIVAGLVPEISRDEALGATHKLLIRLADAGVVHPDLNVKNVLLVRSKNAELTAMVIDVDVVRWHERGARGEVMQANVNRLARSIRKWRTHFGCDISDVMIDRFSRDALAAAPTRTAS